MLKPPSAATQLSNDKARGAELNLSTDYFMRAVEVVKENKQRYEAAQAQALLHPKSPMAGFMRSFVTSQVIRGQADDD
jgi:hypothetical protein